MQVAAMPNQYAWNQPSASYLPDLTNVDVESPRAPEYPILDKVELAINSLYAGRVGAHSTHSGLEQRWDLDTNRLQSNGVLGKGAMLAAGKTALVAGGLSVLKNMASLANGDVNVARATGNVSSDVITGTISGMVAGGVGAMAANGFINSGHFISGTVGTLVGAVGFVAADYVLDKTGLKGYITDKVTAALEGLDGQSNLPVVLQNQPAAPYSG